MEQMMMLKQAKEKIDSQQEAMQDLKDDNRRLQEKINNRNEQIAQMSKSGDMSEQSAKTLRVPGIFAIQTSLFEICHSFPKEKQNQIRPKNMG